MKTNEALISDRDDKIFVLIMYLTVPIQALKKSFRYEEVALLHKLLISSAQRVPKPDPLPSISFATRPDPIQFWKSSGSG